MFFVVLSYILLTTFLAFVIGLKTTDIESFFFSRRNLSFIFLSTLFTAELIGGASTIGMIELSSKIGISAVWFNVSIALSCFFVIYTADWYYQSGVSTVPEAFMKIFDRRTQKAVAFITVVVYFSLYSVEVAALSKIISPMLKCSFLQANIISTSLFVLIVLTGGMISISRVNFFHAIAIIVGMTTALFFSLKNLGGLKALSLINTELFNPVKLGYFKIGAWLFGTPLAFIAAQPLIQSLISAKDIKTAKKALIFSGLGVMIIAIIIAFTGILNSLSPSKANKLFYLVQHMPPLWGGLIIASISGAILSTAPMLLLALITVIEKDVLYLFEFVQKHKLFTSRMLCVVFGVLSVITAPYIKEILPSIMKVFQMRAVVGVIFILGVRKIISKELAFWSIVIGGITSLSWTMFGNPSIEPFYPTMISLFLLLTTKKLLHIKKNA